MSVTAIIDYGVGNLFSLASSLEAVGCRAVVTRDRQAIADAERIILPGVGAFADAAARLRSCGMDEAVCREAERGKPLLGICLGMQLLLDRSLEYGEHAGLGLIPGTVRPIADTIPAGLKIPHIGWNSLDISRPGCPLLRDTAPGEFVYFVHSYWADAPEEYIAARTDYGAPLTAVVWRDNVCGAQFHPEKSGRAGLAMLRAFCAI